MREWYIRKDANIQFDIATIGEGIAFDELVSRGCKVYTFEPIRKTGVVKYIKQSYQIIRSGDYDIVHSHVGMLSCFIFFAAILAKKKRRILHAHGTKYNSDKGGILNKTAVFFLKKSSVILATDYLACSTSAAEYLFGKRKTRKKARIIHNGIDFTRFKPLHSDSKRNIIGYVARIEESKNHIFLLKVLAKLLNKGVDVELLLIGGGDSSCIRRVASDLHIDEYVTILPPQSKIEEFYQKMSVFAFPSLNEGLGIVAIEAQACGLPTIISPGVPDDALASSLAKKVELDEDLWAMSIEEMLKNQVQIDVHHELAGRGFDIVASTKELMNIYLEE